jgi:hypothetical protein
MKGDPQFNGTEAGRQMAARGGYYIHNGLADLPGQIGQFRARQFFEIRGRVNFFKQV